MQFPRVKHFLVTSALTTLWPWPCDPGVDIVYRNHIFFYSQEIRACHYHHPFMVRRWQPQVHLIVHCLGNQAPSTLYHRWSQHHIWMVISRMVGIVFICFYLKSILNFAVYCICRFCFYELNCINVTLDSPCLRWLMAFYSIQHRSHFTGILKTEVVLCIILHNSHYQIVSQVSCCEKHVLCPMFERDFSEI